MDRAVLFVTLEEGSKPRGVDPRRERRICWTMLSSAHHRFNASISRGEEDIERTGRGEGAKSGRLGDEHGEKTPQEKRESSKHDQYPPTTSATNFSQRSHVGTRYQVVELSTKAAIMFWNHSSSREKDYSKATKYKLKVGNVSDLIATIVQ